MKHIVKNTLLLQKDFRQAGLSQSGFSLIELLVGLVVGLLATLAIVQVFSSFEGTKRTTSGNSDAQTNGSIALMNIQRDVQRAGYGLPLPNADKANNALNCNTFADYDPDNNAATLNSTNLFPLVIQNGAAATDSDTITVRYSPSAVGGVPTEIVSSANSTIAVGMVLENNIGCSDNDIALLVNGATCRMTTVADANGTPNTSRNIRLNALTPIANPLISGAKLTCMGNWQNYTYQIVNNELRLNGMPIIADVVNMQAQYGISASANSNVVTQWVNPTGIWAAGAATPTVANRNRIKAIRVAVVVRNGLLEKLPAVSAACSSTTAANPIGVCAWDGSEFGQAPTIDLTNLPQWSQYRYRVFNTIIPFRNMLWNRGAF
jgi:type IV pilus assembly protein PilW